MSIESELEALRRKDGLIVAEDAVEWAKRHPKSELYGMLEWDDREAAHQYRLWQMRRIIHMAVSGESREPIHVSLTVDRTRPGGGYRVLSDVLRNDQFRSVLLNDARAVLRNARERYRHLNELAQVWAAIDEDAAKEEQTDDAAD